MRVLFSYNASLPFAEYQESVHRSLNIRLCQLSRWLYFHDLCKKNHYAIHTYDYVSLSLLKFLQQMKDDTMLEWLIDRYFSVFLLLAESSGVMISFVALDE